MADTNIDWDELDKKYGFKSYAEDGPYKVRLDGVEVKDVGSNGNKIVKFHIEETDDVKFPTIDHWLSVKNKGWRMHHMKDLYIALGSTEEKAKKCCELAESKDFDYAGKAYAKGFELLLAKKPEIEIEVYTENGYSRADFADRAISMRRDSSKKKEEPMAGAEPVADDDEIVLDIPF